MAQLIDLDKLNLDARDAGLELTGYYADFVLEDSGGNRLKVRYHLVALGGITPMYEALAGVTSAEILTATISAVYHADAFEQPPVSSQIEAKAKVRLYDSVLAAKTHTFYIPSPIAGMFISPSGDGANIIDPANAELLAWVSMFEAGGRAYANLRTTELADGMSGGTRVTHKSKRG